VIFSLVLLATASATAPAPVEPVPPWGLARLRQDVRLVLTRPFHLDGAGKRRALLVGAATFGLYGLRDEVRREVREDRSASRSDLLQTARWMSRGAVAPGIAAVTWAASLATGDDRERETAQRVLTSAGLAAAIAGAGQVVLATDRPEDGDRVRFFRSGGHGVSMDASLAAAIVPPLRCAYLRVRPEDGRGRRVWKRGLAGLLYAGAGLAALQRVDDDKHWAPDVFLGLANGFTVGEILCRQGSRPRGPSPRGSRRRRPA
jgi:membrane-associated phospholipid phosphatase